MNKNSYLDGDFKKIRSDQYSSDRSFGFLLSFIFITLSFINRSQSELVVLFLLLALINLLLSIYFSNFFSGLNLLWNKFSQLLSKIWTPIIMAVLFFGFFTPYAFALRIFGIKTNSSRKKASLTSYWIESQKKETNFEEQF